MEKYEILMCEPGFEGVILGTIQHTPGSGGAVLALNGREVLVPYYANVDAALQDVRGCYGYGGAYLQKVREVAA